MRAPAGRARAWFACGGSALAHLESEPMASHVFFFGDGKAEGDPKRRDLLGGKGAGLAEMTSLGLPVPPGFTLGTDVCNAFAREKRFADETRRDVEEALGRVEKAMN